MTAVTEIGKDKDLVLSDEDKKLRLEKCANDLESANFTNLKVREYLFKKCVEDYFTEEERINPDKIILENRLKRIEDFLKTNFILLKDKYLSQVELEGRLLSFIYDFLDADTLVIFLVKLESMLETSILLINICKKMLLGEKVFSFYAKRTLESMIYTMNYHVLRDEELINHEHYGEKIADIKLRSRRNSISRSPDRYCYKDSKNN